MIKIVNISTKNSPKGFHNYEVFINNDLICKFAHNRTSDGLSRCLRDAADSIDYLRKFSKGEYENV